MAESSTASMSIPGAGEQEEEASGRSLPGRKSFDPQSVVEFFRNTRTYDVMPENGKVALVEDSLTLADLLEVFIEHQLGAASLWQDESCQGLLTPAHLAAMVASTAGSASGSELESALAGTTVGDWLGQPGRPGLDTASATPDTTVLDALEQMHTAERPRQLLAIRELAMETPVFVLNHARILRYVMSHFHDAEGDALLDQSITALKIGERNPDGILKLDGSVSMLDAQKELLSTGQSYAAVLDAEGVVVGLVTHQELVTLAGCSERWGWLERPVSEFLDSCPSCALLSCLKTEALLDVLRRLAQQGSSRMVIVDLDGKLEGVVLLEDLFWHFVRSPGGDAPAEDEETGPAPAGEEEPEDDASATMQFGRFAVTDFDDDE